MRALGLLHVPIATAAANNATDGMLGAGIRLGARSPRAV